ncbi:MAG: hypothetical protein ACI8P9_005011 [Parasphingorhabdus sp.]|jgi:hypothetical protein
MFNSTQHVIDAFVKEVYQKYKDVYGDLEPHYPGLIEWAGRMALERISNTDCLYHNVEHTILVTLAGQEILRGKQIRERSVKPLDWVTVTVALLCHDIGYVRGICSGDRPGQYVTDDDGNTIDLPRGVSDAYLTQYHVDRGKVFVRERFTGHPVLDPEIINQCIEKTRFPPKDNNNQIDDGDFPSLVRAADLIGQMADPMYLCKVGALYQEFKESGLNEKLGYQSPADLSRGYPAFYWNTVSPLIQPALAYLRLTHDGKQWVAHLYAHIFAAEHNEPVLGPELANRY